MQEKDLLQMAGAYRDMASKALNQKLRLEFAERAERYEMVASMVGRRASGPAAAMTRQSGGGHGAS